MTCTYKFGMTVIDLQVMRKYSFFSKHHYLNDPHCNDAYIPHMHTCNSLCPQA